MEGETQKEGLTYEKWEETVPKPIRDDPVWTVTAYRLALFAGDIGWHDVTKLVRDARTRKVAGQLCDALGSTGANTSEGYSRSTGKDRASFYQYALGSAREARTWYFGSRHLLGDKVTEHRIGILTDIIKLLEKMIPDQRGYTVHEEPEQYRTTNREVIPW